MTYCSRGCGEEASYITKNGVFLCHRNPGKCACVNPKGKAKTNRRKATAYLGEEKCEFCKTHKATHTLVNGKLCCSSTAGNCKEVRKIASRKISKTKENDIDENGLNAHQRNGLRISQWYDGLPQEEKDKRSEIQKVRMNTNGEAKRRAKKMVMTKLSNIDKNGLNGFDRSHLKSKNVGYIDGIFYQ